MKQQIPTTIDLEQHSLNSLGCLQEALTNMNGQLRHNLDQLKKGYFVPLPGSHRLQVQPLHCGKPGDAQQDSLQIRLTGDWLRKAGFETRQQVRVISLHQLLVICPEESLAQEGKISRPV